MKEKDYEKYTKKALNTLSEIIKEAEDPKVKISAIKELLNVTADKKNNKEEGVGLVVIKGDVE